MDTVTLSSKFQIIIPRCIREALDLKRGQKMQALQYCGRVELIPLVPLASARGMFRGIATDVERGADRL